MSSGILVINAGSSSLKFAVFVETGQPEPELLVKGQMEGLDSDPSFQVKGAVGTVIDERDEWPRGSPLGHAGALRYILDWLGENASQVRVAAAAVTASSMGV